MAKRYAHTYGVDYSDIFSHMDKLTLAYLFISLVAFENWPLHQQDINNTFLHCDLQEEVYMEQSPELVAQGKEVWEYF